MSKYYTYIITNKNNTVLYTGFTDNVERRTYEHMNKLLDSFTKKYNCNKLVYFEEFSTIEDANIVKNKLKGIKENGKKT